MTTVPPRGDDPPSPPEPHGVEGDQLQAEVRRAVRYERGLAVKLLIALCIVGLVVLLRLLVV